MMKFPTNEMANLLSRQPLIPNRTNNFYLIVMIAKESKKTFEENRLW